MRIVLLTTDTSHHCYFVRELSARFRIEAVLVESNTLNPPFDVHHRFETVREDYERRVWFDGEPVSLLDLASAKAFGSLNDDDALNVLAEVQPDIVVVFGTGRLSSDVIKTCPQGILNLHGGDPEQDRGLDTHLWAIYEDRFDGLVTTLHRVNDRLDDGEVVGKAPIPLHRLMKLHELRRFNTTLCLHLVGSALDEYQRCGHISSRPQQTRGRYYSFMPAELKATCQQKFEQHTSRLH